MSHIVLHAGDYGYVEGSPMYVVHVTPGSDYAFMADCYNQHRVVDISDFQFKGHLIKDLHLFFDDCYIDFNILTSTGMFTVVRI